MQMFQSATRVSLLILILSLVGINVFSLYFYPETAFKTTFDVFTTTIVAVTSFFFGKSSADQEKKTGETSLDKKTDALGNDFTQSGL